MNYLLKIVEGPNKGAEIALVEGLCISVGKADSCDVILADATLPDAPIQLEAAADSVSIELPGEGRTHLEPYHVVAVGSTAFAVGGADAVWPALVWPKKDEPQDAAPAPAPAEEKPAEKPAESEKKPAAEDDRKKKGGWLIPVIIVVVVILLLAVLAWLFRDRIAALLHHEEDTTVVVEQVSPLDALIEKFSLKKSEENGRISLYGDFETRAERLTATAGAYAALPGVTIDFADEESLKAAIEETFALVGEKELSVEDVSKRVAKISGRARNLRAALEAISSDVPKIANVDCSDVTAIPGAVADTGTAPDGTPLPVKAKKRAKKTVDFPVCGILTSPYPCLVMSNGMRVLEGAPFGDGAIVKIEADCVVFTNSTGRVVWKP